MDPALLKERESFKRKAFATPVVETKKRKEDGGNSEERRRPEPRPPPQQLFRSHASAPGSAFKFGVLTKIVKHLKQKFQDGEDSPLSIEDILDETNQLDADNKTRMWLMSEALPNNPKIEMTPEGTFMFRPPLKCRDKRSFLRLLRLHDMKGLGGILRDDVLESVPRAEKVLKLLEQDIITITRQDKKKVLFYNDRGANFQVDEEFQKQWRLVAVEGIDDAKVEEYLDKVGIRSMEGQAAKKLTPKKKATRKKLPGRIKDNEHLQDVLQSYEGLK